jgi:hypothetical protein
MTETISHEEIKRIHGEFVLRNTLLSPVKAAALLGCSVRKVFKLIEEAQLEEANDTPGRAGTRVTAWSVEQYRLRCVQRSLQHRAGG